mmetsp:Transcript_93006/g.259112  ORF Transcript_93006/g.259112 Transcript_93006/m.259112 type:complete len:275 (+) Transcript_93006:89-913(+)
MSKEEKQTSVMLPDKIQLDGAWSFQAQFDALKACNAQDDLTFKSNSVKDVSDRGREEGAARLQKALEIALSSDPARASRKRALPAPTSSAEQLEEVEVRREVRALLTTLQRLREDGPHAKRDESAMGVLRQLGDLNVSVACLKATRIAAELNQPSWRGSEVSAEVRQYAAALVKEWRAMYRAETGSLGDETLSPAARSRKCRNLSMDLEACTHGRHQKVAHYIEAIEYLCRLIIADGQASRGLLAGTVASKDLVARALDEIRRRKERLKHGLRE